MSFSVTRPHKAETAIISDLRFPAIVMPKIDGVRGIKILPSFTGRSLKPFRNRLITNEFSNPLFTGFDGEISKGDITSQTLCRDTTSWVNSSYEKTDGILPDWYLFDFVNERTAHLPYAKRWDLLQQYVSLLKAKDPGKYHYLKVVPRAFEATTPDEVEEAHFLFTSLGFEGTIIRYANLPHKNGRSTIKEGAFLRIKDFSQDEGILIDFEEAQENLNPLERNALGLAERSSHKENKTGKGMVGALLLKKLSDGEIIKIGPGTLSHKDRQEIFNNPSQYLGETITYKFMPYGQKDKPRLATFHSWRIAEDLG